MFSEKYSNCNIPVINILSCRSFQDGGDALKIKLRKDRKVDFETNFRKVIDSEGDFDKYLPITYKYVEKSIQPLRTYFTITLNRVLEIKWGAPLTNQLHFQTTHEYFFSSFKKY